MSSIATTGDSVLECFFVIDKIQFVSLKPIIWKGNVNLIEPRSRNTEDPHPAMIHV